MSERAVIMRTDHLVHIPCAVRPYFLPGFVRGKFEAQVFAISFLDLVEFIANVKFVTEVLSVAEIMLRS